MHGIAPHRPHTRPVPPSLRLLSVPRPQGVGLEASGKRLPGTGVVKRGQSLGTYMLMNQPGVEGGCERGEAAASEQSPSVTDRFRICLLRLAAALSQCQEFPTRH